MTEAEKHSRTSRAKLTDTQVKQIRAIAGKFPTKHIAAYYAVSERTIRNVVAGDTWKFVAATVLLLCCLMPYTAAGVMYLAVESEGPFTVCWTQSVGAGGYRLYWNTVSTEWLRTQAFETSELCATDHARDPLPGEVIYYVVTAYNYGGESETEHGPII